ncbi:MAG: hypothetical protein QXU72_05635 [Thermofilum sp.]
MGKVKCFSLELKRKDPTPLDVKLTTSAFLVKNGEIVKLTGISREFQEADIIDFEREIGSVVGITYNDVVHGEASVKVEDIELHPRARVVKVLEVEERLTRRKTRYFIAVEVLESGERVIYSSHRAVKSSSELQALSKHLGVREKALKVLANQI